MEKGTSDGITYATTHLDEFITLFFPIIVREIFDLIMHSLDKQTINNQQHNIKTFHLMVISPSTFAEKRTKFALHTLCVNKKDGNSSLWEIATEANARNCIRKSAGDC